MGGFKGINFSVNIGANAIGASRTGRIHLTRPLINMSTKDSGDDAEYNLGVLSADGAVDALYSPADTAQDAAETAIGAGTTVALACTTGTTGEQKITFTAHVDNVTKSAPNETEFTTSFSFQNDGAVTFVDET